MVLELLSKPFYLGQTYFFTVFNILDRNESIDKHYIHWENHFSYMSQFHQFSDHYIAHI